MQRVESPEVATPRSAVRQHDQGNPVGLGGPGGQGYVRVELAAVALQFPLDVVGEGDVLASPGFIALREALAPVLPGLSDAPVRESDVCLFTNTPNEDFIIDRADNLTILSPCSGHGAKFAPLIGQWAADLATGAGGVPPRFRPASSTAVTT